MTPLESRKLLLLAESDLNRVHMTEEWNLLAGEVHTMIHRAGTITSLVSAAATLGIGAGLFRRKPDTQEVPKTSWLQKLTKGAEIALALWPVLRSTIRR